MRNGKCLKEIFSHSIWKQVGYIQCTGKCAYETPKVQWTKQWEELCKQLAQLGHGLLEGKVVEVQVLTQYRVSSNASLPSRRHVLHGYQRGRPLLYFLFAKLYAKQEDNAFLALHFNTLKTHLQSARPSPSGILLVTPPSCPSTGCRLCPSIWIATSLSTLNYFLSHLLSGVYPATPFEIETSYPKPPYFFHLFWPRNLPCSNIL